MSRYLLPIILVLLSVGIYEFSIRPLYGEIETLLAKETEVNAAIVQADAAEAKLAAIKERYESFPPDAALRLSEIIPETIDPIRLLIDTKAFFEQKGFLVKALAVSANAQGNAGAAAEGYQTHSMNFTLSATYDTFRSFLHTLEGSLVLRDPADISFTTAPTLDTKIGEKPELITHDYIISIKGYSLR